VFSGCFSGGFKAYFAVTWGFSGFWLLRGILRVSGFFVFAGILLLLSCFGTCSDCGVKLLDLLLSDVLAFVVLGLV